MIDDLAGFLNVGICPNFNTKGKSDGQKCPSHI